MGDSIGDLRSRFRDFPAATTSGTVVVIWKNCDLTFTDGVLVSIAPHGGGTTIDGVGPGSTVAEATGMYGDPIAVEDSSSTLVYTADADREYAYRMKIEGLSHHGSSYGGTVKTIVLCTCLPKKASGKWTDPVVIVTPHSVGAVPEAQIPAIAGVSLTRTCTSCDADAVADLSPAADYRNSRLRRSVTG